MRAGIGNETMAGNACDATSTVGALRSVDPRV